jgi:hypothetical protein
MTIASYARGQTSLQRNMRQVTLPIDVPLRIRTTKTAVLKKGAPVEGTLTEPIYLWDRIVVPEGASLIGEVSEYEEVDKTTRTQALLNGDVTPLHKPVISFNTIHTSRGDIAIYSRAVVREVQMVRFSVAGDDQGLIQRAKEVVKSRIHDAHDVIVAPGAKDRALRLLYSQLPYHPQRIWVGTQFVADLVEPTTFDVPAEDPVPMVTSASRTDVGVQATARLTTSLSSDLTRKGDSVTAVLTKPVFTPQHELLFPEGTALRGTVLQVRRSRSFGRNGGLRFTFTELQRHQEAEVHLHGMLTAASGDKSQNLSVDDEGGVRSNPDKGRFVAPALLGLLTFVGQTQDHDGSGLGRQTVAANGFGLAARILALTVNDRNVAIGFGSYSFAKSIYFHFIARGHAVVFPKDTLLEVSLINR